MGTVMAHAWSALCYRLGSSGACDAAMHGADTCARAPHHQAGEALPTPCLCHCPADAEPVVLLTASVLPVFALTLPGDGCNAALQGLLRCGRLLLHLRMPAIRLPAAAVCILLSSKFINHRSMAAACLVAGAAGGRGRERWPTCAATGCLGSLPPTIWHSSEQFDGRLAFLYRPVCWACPIVLACCVQTLPSACPGHCRKHMGMHGLWWGLVIVNTVQASCVLLLVVLQLVC